MWRKYDAMSLATPKAFAANPSLVWQFYHMRREKSVETFLIRLVEAIVQHSTLTRL
jgi:NAD-dependent SIR2 family protein deacetylase